MKVRDGGMPDEALWEQLFDVELTLHRRYGVVLTHSNDAERRP